MNHHYIAGDRSLFAALQRLARRQTITERCELCGAEAGSPHRHLLEMANHQIVCACEACALCFQGVVGGRFKLLPRFTRSLPDFRMTEAQWENLALPINLAFLFYCTASGKMKAQYPSPAGATESLLPLASWQELTAANPALGQMEPDVEALLINRVGGSHDYFLAPLDVCYELVGLIRLHWRGLSGGEVAWDQIKLFFDRLKAQADPLTMAAPEVAHA